MKSLMLALAMVATGFAQGALAAGDGRPTVGVAEFTNQSGAALPDLSDAR